MTPNNEDISMIVRILKQLDLFKGLNEADHTEIIKRIMLEYYPKGHLIFREGDSGDAFYIIKRGMVRIYREAAGGEDEKETSMLGDGDFFGEMALISDKPRNNSAQTVEESEIFKLGKSDFIQLVSSTPDMASRISGEFLRRLKINTREQN
jgi:CRP/FNR family transcriptional regulator, cyclic AMP receptor protein